MKKTTRVKKYTVIARFLHQGEVYDQNGRSVAWCGQSNGYAVARRIAKALNSSAKKDAEIRDLRAEAKHKDAENAKARGFMEHLSSLQRNDPRARKGKRWDILSDVLNSLIDEAATLTKDWRKP